MVIPHRHRHLSGAHFHFRLFIRQMQQFQLDKRQIVCLSRIRIRHFGAMGMGRGMETRMGMRRRTGVGVGGGGGIMPNGNAVASVGSPQVCAELGEECGRGMCVTREIQFPQTPRLRCKEGQEREHRLRSLWPPPDAPIRDVIVHRQL